MIFVDSNVFIYAVGRSHPLRPEAQSFFLNASKKGKRLAMINADWRDFQNTPAIDETGEHSILIDEYLTRIRNAGWKVTHIIQAPMSSERFQANVVAAMQKKKILGVTSRYVIVAIKAG